jgi:CelD/BcsL family acetyltransferase involved in cellulose biosynthesis
VLADPRLRAFHDMAARELLRRGLLRLFVLLIDDRPAAAFYGFADRSRWHAYIGGFDSELPHPGLGAMLLGQIIELARAEGASELHLLRGREPYKYAWGAVDRPLWSLCLRAA